MNPPSTPDFLPLTGVYEPSAVVQLPDGRFLVVEDEKEHPLSLVTIDAQLNVKATALTAGLFQLFSTFWKLDDLEGLSTDNAGYVYGITSHSRDESGDDKGAREKLVRFRVEGDRVKSPQVVSGLKRALTAQHPLLAVAAELRDVKVSGGLNIEGMEVSPDRQQMLIGFRSPLHQGRALIASVENLQAVFESDEAPRVAPALFELDLKGHGIRSLSYVPDWKAYLVISGPVSRETIDFELWRWSGQAGAPAQRLAIPGLRSLRKAEGVCPAVVGGTARILIVSDDGNRKAQRAAGYLLLDPSSLQPAA